MGRKKTKLGKVYFTQETEDAIIKYNQSDDMEERENLYREYIWAPFDKLAENVINRFKFPYMEGSFDDVKSEVVSFLVINLHKYAVLAGLDDGVEHLVEVVVSRHVMPIPSSRVLCR